MSTGIVCTGPESGLGKDCSGSAQPETRLCPGCTHEARSLGREIRRYGLAEQFAYAWGPRRPAFSSGKREPELEIGA